MAARDVAARSRLSLGPESVALLFGTEGATDLEVYQQIVGRSADQVRASVAA
jgi:diaminopropionate ammonia-lyase